MSPLSGVLVVDKPEGPTSHDMVARARRLLGTRAVGHAGTLDPMATGVLVLCVGRGTRLARFLTRRRKTYRGTLRLGYETDTQDRTGRPLGEPGPVTAGEADVRRVLLDLTGTHMQLPPRFSAKRVNGTRAHLLARSGRPVQPDPVPVTVEELRLLGMAGPEVSFEVRCSAGTYVRALAAAIGTRLGCGAHLTALRRTASGEFDVARALSAPEMEALGAENRLRGRLIPLRELEMGLPAVTAGPRALLRVAQGGALGLADLVGSIPGSASACRVLCPEGELLAIGELEGQGESRRVQPRVVLRRPEEVAASVG